MRNSSLFVQGTLINIHQNISSFILDVLGECVFGIKIDSLNNPDHPFALNVKKFLENDANYRQMISIAAPKLARFFNLEYFRQDVINYFSILTEKIISERKSRNNLIDGQGELNTIKNHQVIVNEYLLGQSLHRFHTINDRL